MSDHVFRTDDITKDQLPVIIGYNFSRTVHSEVINTPSPGNLYPGNPIGIICGICVLLISNPIGTTCR